ncbi:hypothetical protein K0B90_03075 [bacterium]|nr:hypothetical protein [bacterium]
MGSHGTCRLGPMRPADEGSPPRCFPPLFFRRRALRILTGGGGIIVSGSNRESASGSRFNWNRVMSNDSRDSDVFLLGVGYRWGAR